MEKRETTTIKDTLIAENQLIAERLKVLDEKKVDKAFVKGSTVRYQLLSDNNFNDTYKKQLDGLETTITEAIEALDVDDTANERKYVSSVNEVDGKIIVERAEHLGGIKVFPDAGIDENDTYNTKFLYTNSEGRLVYYSPSILREGQKVTLATAAQLCTKQVIDDLNALNIPEQGQLIIGDANDHEYLSISHGIAENSIVIRYMVDGKTGSEFSSETCTWSAGVPMLTLTANILNAIAKTNFDINTIISPQATFDKQVVLLRETDVTDDYKDLAHPTPSEKCRLVSRAGVENAINKINERISRVEAELAARVRVLEEEHNHGTAGTSLLAIDAEGNEINAVVVDENGNEVPAEIVK